MDGQPREGGKRGADRGIDGLLYYMEDAKTARRAIISVKGGRNIHAEHVRDLIGTMHTQGDQLGLMITLHNPTDAMDRAAKEAGTLEAFNKPRPAVQIFTVAQLLAGLRPNLPPVLDIIATAAAARRASAKKAPKAPTPADIRKSPPLKLPITGGRSRELQDVLDIDDPLLVQQQDDAAAKRGRRRA
ncbi:MAG: restriction endonuclease [Gammaproteobacteria bacterium]